MFVSGFEFQDGLTEDLTTSNVGLLLTETPGLAGSFS